MKSQANDGFLFSVSLLLKKLNSKLIADGYGLFIDVWIIFNADIVV